MSDATAAADAPKEKKAPTPAAKDKKPNIFQRIALFVSQVVAEMKKVTYPTRSETWTYFVVVVVFVAVIMAYTGILDFAFGKLTTWIFG